MLGLIDHRLTVLHAKDVTLFVQDSFNLFSIQDTARWNFHFLFRRTSESSRIFVRLLVSRPKLLPFSFISAYLHLHLPCPCFNAIFEPAWVTAMQWLLNLLLQ
ncbi:hypothetical protein Nepgr_027759 [Nepenthes gracilis]|uniref:Uncharacterized protein n=1 Tax=Nepenthes gracilis TaxID=150966 RepID=A0AAD3TB41_NEPGR|nr:hypothetical protein Nepgr_027759 [Nepenthes gracilis]